VPLVVSSGHDPQIRKPNPVKVGEIRHNCGFVVSNIHLTQPVY
jgi:hypothetical protein